MWHAYNLSMEALTLIGLSASKEHLLVLYLNVPRTPHAWSSRDLSLSGTWVLTRVNSYCLWGPAYVAHYCYQSTDVRCLSLRPMTEVWPVHKPPSLELKPVSAKRLQVIARGDLHGTGVTGCEQCTEVTSHHTFLNSVHVARSMVTILAACASWYTLNLSKPLCSFTIPLLSISQAFHILKMLSLLLWTLHPSNPNLFKGMIFTPLLPLLYDFNAHNML